jgi:hypothetical protein
VRWTAAAVILLAAAVRRSDTQAVKRKGRRYTVWLTPFEERALQALQRDGVPDGARPRSVNRTFAEAVVRVYNATRPSSATNDERDVIGRGRRTA